MSEDAPMNLDDTLVTLNRLLGDYERGGGTLREALLQLEELHTERGIAQLDATELFHAAMKDIALGLGECIEPTVEGILEHIAGLTEICDKREARLAEQGEVINRLDAARKGAELAMAEAQQATAAAVESAIGELLQALVDVADDPQLMAPEMTAVTGYITILQERAEAALGREELAKGRVRRHVEENATLGRMHDEAKAESAHLRGKVEELEAQLLEADGSEERLIIQQQALFKRVSGAESKVMEQAGEIEKLKAALGEAHRSLRETRDVLGQVRARNNDLIDQLADTPEPRPASLEATPPDAALVGWLSARAAEFARGGRVEEGHVLFDAVGVLCGK